MKRKKTEKEVAYGKEDSLPGLSLAAAPAAVLTDYHYRGVLIHRIEGIGQLDRLLVRALPQAFC